ncbi:alpha/beta fold hydrolase [Nocardiopsis potens]|uniref:alpha/beta fold hydrolase n=1 Tax=Nocardiopsis potens TaxID=1246458 RepID=UPI0004757C2A|nr:alpha/beta hydrolase [Nocardiopsis potens]
MAEFVLTAGAWLGAWAWDGVVPELRAAGHGAHPLTLSGVAERQDEPVGPQTHVQDIVTEVERRDLRGVVLVGHSYSGIPVGQAAERIGDRLARVVFVDSNVPADGESFVSPFPVEGAQLEAEMAANGGAWPPPDVSELGDQGLTAQQLDRFAREATPHPGASLTDRAVLDRPLSELPATYIKCLLDGAVPNPDVVELLKSDRWRLVEMHTGHWPMFSRPQELARILLEATDS